MYKAGHKPTPAEETQMTLETALNVITQDRNAKLAREAYRGLLNDTEVAQDVALTDAMDRAFPEAAQAVVEAKRTLAANGLKA
jgi:hypothetical protein